MPERQTHHEDKTRKPLLIETEAGVTVEQMPTDALVLGIATLAKEQGVNMNFSRDESAQRRMKECGESIVAVQQELSHRFSTMQERINSLEAELAVLKGKE